MSLPQEPQFAGQVLDHYDLMDVHIRKYFPEASITVYSELQSIGFQLDVFCIRPAKAACQIILTSGMSTARMRAPVSLPNPMNHVFAELMMVLPPNWKFSPVVPSDDKQDWPISTLKHIARLPFAENFCLGVGQLIHNQATHKPFHDSIPFGSCIILPPVTTSPEFNLIPSPHGPINLYTVFPIYPEEAAFKLDQGYDAFVDRLVFHKLTEVMNPDRKNTALI